MRETNFQDKAAMINASRPARFSNIRSITLYIPAAQGADETRISYIGFKGEFSEVCIPPLLVAVS